MNDSPLKQPTALLPIAMSLAGLGLVLGHAAIYGVVHEADEGAAAHIFQILMVAQVPLVAYFAIKWLPRAPGEVTPRARTAIGRGARRVCLRLLAHLSSKIL